MNGVDFGLKFGHPGRVDDRHGLDTQLRARQGELDLGEGHLHGYVTVILQTLPHLVTIPPQSLQEHKVDYGGIRTVTQSN